MINSKVNWKTTYYILLGVGLLLVASVMKSSPAEKYAYDLHKYLHFAKEIKVERVGNLIIVEGEATTSPEWDRINEVITSLNPAIDEKTNVKVINRVELSGQSKEFLASEIEKQIGSPEIVVRTLGPAVVLEGTADSDFDADRSIQIAKLILQRDLPVVQTLASAKEASSQRQISSMGKARWPQQIADMLKVRPKK